MRHALILSLCLAAPLGLQAPTAQALSATQVVEKEVVTQNDDGTEVTIRTPATSIVPGERVVYTLNYVNDDADPATDIVLTMPVPDSITYMDGSAAAPGAQVRVSTDGGLNFVPRSQARIVDGDTSRAASAADITHIRWTVAGPVAPQEAGSLAFKGVLK